VNKASLGTEGTPFEVDIERGKIAEFAKSVRSSHADHFAAEGATIPPTFLQSTFFWETLVPGSNPWDAVQMDPARGMHAEQEYVFHGPPPRAGDKLMATSRIDKVWEKTRKSGAVMTFVTMVTEFRDRDSGVLVATGTLTGVEL
jgi:hypothetical protein